MIRFLIDFISAPINDYHFWKSSENLVRVANG
jgi:hypothetical protein